MAQGFISGFLRGLGTGVVMLSALSIYVGINAQGDHETDRVAATDQGLQSQPPVQNELSQNNADTDPTIPETPAVDDSEIQEGKNTDAGSESQETSELTQNSSTDDAGDGQVDENQSQIQAANLPDEPIIAQIPNNPKGIEQPDVTALPGPPSDSAANQPIAMPVDPDPNENALSELDQMVVIKPDNKISQNEPLVPNAAEPQTPVLPLTPSAPGLPSRDENNRSNVTRDYVEFFQKLIHISPSFRGHHLTKGKVRNEGEILKLVLVHYRNCIVKILMKFTRTLPPHLKLTPRTSNIGVINLMT